MKAMVAGGIAVSVAWVLGAQIQRIGATLEEKKGLFVLLDKRSETVEKLRQELAEVGSTDSKIEAAFPQRETVTDFVAALEGAANKYSLRPVLNFGSPIPGAPVEDGIAVSTIDYSLSVHGNVPTIITFLEDFEKLPFFTSITSIALQAPPERGWEAEASVLIKAKVYVRSQ